MAETGSPVQVTSEDVLQMTESILSEMLGLTVQSAPEGLAPNQGSGLTGCVPITGDWDGAVTVGCSEGFARGVAAAMFEMDPNELEIAELLDAVSEITNMFGGNIKSLFPGSCRLALPSVTAGKDYQVSLPGSELDAAVAFLCDGEAVEVKILRKSAEES